MPESTRQSIDWPVERDLVVPPILGERVRLRELGVSGFAYILGKAVDVIHHVDDSPAWIEVALE